MVASEGVVVAWAGVVVASAAEVVASAAEVVASVPSALPVEPPAKQALSAQDAAFASPEWSASHSRVVRNHTPSR